MPLKSCLVLGGAACVWEDLIEARGLGTFDAVCAINEAGAYYPGQVDVWASLHPEKFHIWARLRQEFGHSRAFTYAAHANNTHQGRPKAWPLDHVTDYRWPGMSSSGSSGLFAVKVMMEQGFDRIVLCGVPMNADPHFFDARAWNEYTSFVDGWKVALPHVRDFARSMSGQTREWLGAPTRAWLAG